MCPKFAAPRQRQMFPIYRTFDRKFGSTGGTRFIAEVVRARAYAARRLFLLRKARCIGRELLVLRFGRQGVVGFGIVDDVAEKFLAERRQRSFPELPGGFALFDENPL